MNYEKDTPKNNTAGQAPSQTPKNEKKAQPSDSNLGQKKQQGGLFDKEKQGISAREPHTKPTSPNPHKGM